MLMANAFPEHCCDLKADQRCRDGRVGTKSGCDVGLLTTGATRAASAPGHLTWAASALLAHLTPGSVRREFELIIDEPSFILASRSMIYYPTIKCTMQSSQGNAWQSTSAQD